MPISGVYLKFGLLALVVAATRVATESASKFGLQVSACRLLESKFAASQPWTEYPIVFGPIVRGHLTIWTGVSNLPTSEFKCYAHKNTTESIILEFTNYANKLEWTYYDPTRGKTHLGTSMSHYEDAKFRLTLKGHQSKSYLECNTVEDIVQLNPSNSTIDVQTSCSDCGLPILTMINSQVKELLRDSLDNQLRDGIFWHSSQLLTTQHFAGSVPLRDNFN